MQFIKRGYRLLLIGILALGFFLRFIGLNWDQGLHLHPDERFLTMVGVAMKVPQTFAQYVDSAVSTMNPANIGFPFFVYGAFPVIANKIIAVMSQSDNYLAFTIQGRMIAALLDTLNIIFVFLLTRRFSSRLKLDRKIPYLAAFFYAIAVLPIQLAHFFTVDPFLNTFLLASLYFATDKKTLILSAISFGLALSSKVNAFFFLPLLLFFLIAENKKRWHITLLLFGFITYIVTRFANPYYFQSANFANPTPSANYIASLKTLQSLQSATVGYPPGIQWIKKTPVLFSLLNISFVGLGIGYFILMVIGMTHIIRKSIGEEMKKMTFSPFFLLLLWTLVLFFYQASQLVQSMRYFLPLYPYFAIFAGVGTASLLKQKRISRFICYFLMIVAVLWPLAFLSIYLKNHTRTEASLWIYKNAENGSVILSEHWDDALPMPIANPYNKRFMIQELPVFALDTNDKWKTMNELLGKGDYYVLSSNRGYGSISTVPEHYPRMSAFYKDLFAGKTRYKKIKELTSFPSFQYLGIPIVISDQWAEEAFSVYDHPVVIIFKKT